MMKSKHSNDPSIPDHTGFSTHSYRNSEGIELKNNFISFSQSLNLHNQAVMSNPASQNTTPAYFNQSQSIDLPQNKQILVSGNFSFPEFDPSIPQPIDEPEKINLDVQDAFSYLNAVRDKFLNRPQIYNQFLHIMIEYKKKKIGTDEVVNNIKTLFSGHPELISYFNNFLPPYSKIDIVGFDEPPSHLQEPSTPLLVSTQSLEIGPSVPKHTPTKLNSQVDIKNEGLMTPSRLLLNVNKSNFYSEKETNRIITSDGASKFALDYITKIRQRFPKNGLVYEKFLETLNKCQLAGKTTAEGSLKMYKLHEEAYINICQIFKNEQDLIDEFIYFLPEDTVLQLEKNGFLNRHKRKMPIVDDTPPKQPPRMKNETPVPESAVQIVAKPISPKKVIHTSGMTNELVLNVNSEWLSKNWKNITLSFLETMLKLAGNKLSAALYSHLSRTLCLYNTSFLPSDEIQSLLKQILAGHPDLLAYFESKIEHTEKISSNQSLSSTKPSESSTFLNSDSIDFDLKKRVGVSYWPYQPSYSHPKCSGRTPLIDSVLNNLYISQPILTEDIPFPTNKKITSLDVLLRVEQERYDFDLILDGTRRAILYLEYCQKDGTLSLDLSLKDKPNSFQLINCVKVLQRIYGENVTIINEALNASRSETIKIILKRLHQKEHEFILSKAKLNQAWAAETRKHSLKGLDFQYANFKNADSKYLRGRNILRELESSDTEIEQNQEKDIYLRFDDQTSQFDSLHFLSYALNRYSSSNKSERLKMNSFVQTFHHYLFLSAPDLIDDNSQEFTLDTSVFSDQVAQVFISSNIFIYLKLFHLLCERLKKAREFCSSDLNLKQLENFAYLTKTHETNSYFCLEKELQQRKKPSCSDKFLQFKSSLQMLLDGTIDTEYFEEFCRIRLGLESYILFTLDKIILAMARQISIITGDISYKNYLYDLQSISHKYKYDDKTKLITNQPEFLKYWNTLFDGDSCYLIIINRENGSTQMNIKLINTGNKHSHSDQDESIDNTWNDYFSNYTDTNSGFPFDSLSKNPLFLRKNHKINKRIASKYTISNLEDANSQESFSFDPDHVICQFNVEVTIPLNSYSFKFIAGTEDFYYVKGSLKQSHDYFESSLRLNKIEKFKNWWTHRLTIVRMEDKPTFLEPSQPIPLFPLDPSSMPKMNLQPPLS